MAKKRATKKERTSKPKYDILFRIFVFPFQVLQFIILLPFKIFHFFSENIKKAKEKDESKKKQKAREAIEAVYEPFQIIEKYSGDIDAWEKKLPKSTIGIVIGARGKGKSAIGIKILENIKAKTKKSIYAMGFNQEDLPAWINVVDDPTKVASNSIVLIDEGGIFFSSRKSMTNANQILSDLILISRHKNLSVLFISQNSANLDINILRQADYLVLKPSSLLQKDFERQKIKDVYEEVKEQFVRFSEHRGLTYIYSEEFRGFVNNPLPSFWSMNISKSFK
ncbi:MAG: hypothetical protein NDI94_06520 [Candidatus Woesearchaeota archaeon]|nr:hypothetical protein [Candidatus Woesearchaeota archaeon]